MSWPPTAVGAWLVLRADQKWAPHPDNDPDAARAPMARFYRLVRASEGLAIDTRTRTESNTPKFGLLRRGDGHLGPPGAAGCDPGDPLPAEERALLIRSFAALPVAVHRPPTVRTVTATP